MAVVAGSQQEKERKSKMSDAVEVTEKVVLKWAKVGIVLNAEAKKHLFKSVLFL